MDDDNVSASERLQPHQRQRPWWILFVVLLLAAYALAQSISDWGERSPLLSSKIERSCGI